MMKEFGLHLPEPASFDRNVQKRKMEFFANPDRTLWSGVCAKNEFFKSWMCKFKAGALYRKPLKEAQDFKHTKNKQKDRKKYDLLCD